MTEAREPTRPLPRRDDHENARAGTVAGWVEAARMWARDKGLPVPKNGPLPPGIVDQYRRRQTRE
ncbi:hypothetical protein [Actinomycetospora termitidis]|uniref:Lsr2 protein n=1 Tax=Actinomycetospora termitidis TaxID=3053470 RepID=A0ABT7MHE4_9PSEU|nr:hypothetical protein [Actinomycetospora sp. Odt1-22]MDL5160105.1 hypothetical protein [Actinomycetospora sp. Odt1-22]